MNEPHPDAGAGGVVLLICAQRTGSGALGSLLDQHPNVGYWGEIFHPADHTNPLNFFSYLEQSPERHSAFLRATQKGEVFDAYVHEGLSKTQKSVNLLDVKYDSTHHLNDAFYTMGDEPGLVRWIREQDTPIIHLRRDNYLRTLVSAKLADAAGVWHSSEKLHSTPLRLSVDEVDAHLEWSAHVSELFAALLERSDHIVDLEYSELFSTDGTLTFAYAREIEKLLSLEPDSLNVLHPVWVKQTLDPLSGVILNFDEIAEHLVDTDSMWMLIE